MWSSGRPLAPLRRRQRGSALAEFGLTLPLFLTMVFGIIEFGQAIWMYNTVCEAAREGARYAATHGTSSGSPATAKMVEDTIKSKTTWLDTTKLTVTTTWQPDNNPGSVVQVKVQYSFLPTLPLVPIQSLAFSSTSRLMISF